MMLEKARIPKEFRPDLLRRFNINNAVVISDKEMVEINAPCPLCEKYFNFGHLLCEVGCPFLRFEIFERGCINYLDRIIGRGNRAFVHFGHKRIYWYSQDNEKVKEILQKINETMNNPEIVEWI